MKYDKVNRKSGQLLNKLTDREAELEQLKKQLSVVQQALDSTLHEVRRFSTEVSTYAEELSKGIQSSSVDQRLKTLSQTVFYISGMISSRLAFTDLELNPRAVEMQQLVRSGVYKKFDKAKHVLDRRAHAKHVTVRLAGSSHRELETLPAFELLPFVLLENAIKYSPPNQISTVQFDELGRDLFVTVTSLGPIVADDEIHSIFLRGFRGKNAERMGVVGDGLGLYLAKFICDYHDVQISASSEQTPRFQFNNVPQSAFSVKLRFRF